MKKYQILLKSLLVTLSLTLTSIFVIQSCDLSGVTDGLELYVDTDLVSLVASIQVVDANEAIAEIAGDIEVEIMGEDAENIYTLMGSKEIEVIDGMINIAVLKSNIPTPDNPLKFSIRTKANGYVSGLKTFVVPNDSVMVEAIKMVNTASPPVGVSVETGSFTSDANGTVSQQIFSSPLDNGKQEKAEVVVPPSTKMYDENGNELTGSVNFTMVHFDERNESSMDAFPGGFDTDNIVDENGNDLGESQFMTAGFTTINMDVGGQSVKTFSQPINVTMTINPDMINPATGQLIAIGDTIPVWSLDGDSDQWKKEGDGVVQDNNGTLEVQFLTDHLSSFNLDWRFNSCYDAVDISVTSNVTNWYSRRYAEVVDVMTGRVYKRTYTSFINGDVIRFYRAPRGRNAKIVVYDGDYWCKGNVIVESQPFNLCGTSASVDFSSLTNISTVRSAGYIQGTCNGTQLRVYTTLYYRESGGAGCNSYWRFLGRIYPWGYFYTNSIELNKTYDIKLRVGNETIIANNVTIDSDVDITLADGTVVNVQLPTGGNNWLYFYMTNIPIPPYICDNL